MLQLLPGFVSIFGMNSLSVMALPGVFEGFRFVHYLAHRILAARETGTGRSRLNRTVPGV
jgi:hypothetical protein